MTNISGGFGKKGEKLLTVGELVQQECQERWRAEITPARITGRDLIQLEKDARRPDYGGKYYKPVTVLSLIDELKRARLFALLLAIATGPRQGELFAGAEREGE